MATTAATFGWFGSRTTSPRYETTAASGGASGSPRKKAPKLPGASGAREKPGSVGKRASSESTGEGTPSALPESHAYREKSGAGFATSGARGVSVAALAFSSATGAGECLASGSFCAAPSPATPRAVHADSKTAKTEVHRMARSFELSPVSGEGLGV